MRRKRFHPLTAPARHDRGMLVGTKGVPTVSTTPPAGRTKGCRKNLPHDPRLENGETDAQAEQRNFTVAKRGFGALSIMAPLCGRSAKVRIKQRLSLQKDTCQGKQSIRDTTESTSVRVATFAQRSISGATLEIALGGDTCPVIDRVAQSDVRSIAPDDDE